MQLLVLILMIVAISFAVKLIKRIFTSISRWRAENEREREIASMQAARAAEAQQKAAVRMAREQQKEAARQEREQEKQKNIELKRTQAVADLEYIEQARRTVIELYGVAEEDYNNATTAQKKEAALKRMLSYDARLRKLDKDRERAAMIMES